MTQSEVKALEGSALAEAVAEHVMGWKKALRHESGSIWGIDGQVWVFVADDESHPQTGAKFLDRNFDRVVARLSPWRPDFDIQAAHVMESSILESVRDQYIDALMSILGMEPDWKGYHGPAFNRDDFWAMMQATPTQRCRAALMVAIKAK